MDFLFVSPEVFVKVFTKAHKPRFFFPARDAKGEELNPAMTECYLLLPAKGVMCYTRFKGDPQERQTKELIEKLGVKEGLGMYDDYAHWLSFSKMS